MNIILPLSFLFLGLFVGSFLNVVILRWGTNKSIIKGRSVCAHTGKPLFWYDLIPVLSFIILKGKSRFSGEALSVQYPLVEIITGILFLGVYQIVGSVSALLFLYLISVSLLIVICFYDLRTKIIPNSLVYSFIVISLLILLLKGFEVGDFWAAPLLWFPFAFLWLVSKGAWIGYGDAKLAWGMGLFLGLWGGISAVLIAFWVGAVISLVLLFLQRFQLSFLPKSLTIKSEVPFAPFLVIGTLLVLFFNLNVFVF